jgi:hypothetical protein
MIFNFFAVQLNKPMGLLSRSVFHMFSKKTDGLSETDRKSAYERLCKTQTPLLLFQLLSKAS